MSAKNLVFVLLAVTVCVSILGSMVASMIRPAEATSDVVRAKMFDLVTFIIGVVSGWLGKPEQIIEPEPKETK